jgi:uncharacterized membrane protein YhaH (DUF805 family)
MEWYIDVLRKYAEFSGRSRRKEYWMFVLVNLIVSIVLTFTEGLLGGPGAVSVLYSLAVFIPTLAVSVRRLHDTERSGWWLLIGLIPVIGALVLLVFMILEGHSGDNDYGSDPKRISDDY